MTTINPETQIVASRYDEGTRTCFYTYEHTDGSRYTVEVPIDELHKQGLGPQRRKLLASKIVTHIQTMPPDIVEDGKA